MSEPESPRTGGVSAAPIDATEERALRVPGARLQLAAEGDGPPVLFLGGSGGDLRDAPSAFGWLPDHRILTLDHRGLGRSTPDDDDTPFTLADHVDDAIAVLDAYGVERASLVGYSFGAMLAQHIAADRPERIDRLALIAAGPGGDRHSWPIHTLADLPPEERARRLLEIQDLRVAERGARPDEIAASVDRQRASAVRHPANGPQRLLAARATHDARDKLSSITADTIVIGGRHDGQAPLAIVEALAAAIPDAALLVLPGGHGFIGQADGPLSHLARLWRRDPSNT